MKIIKKKEIHFVYPLRQEYIWFDYTDQNDYFTVEIDGYFKDESIRIKVPEIEKRFLCCNTAVINDEKGSITFDNDLKNDKLSINIR